MTPGPAPATWSKTGVGRPGAFEGCRDDEEDEATAEDPVCGMQVDPAKAAGKSEHQGQTDVFCSAGCKRKFDSNPQQYVTK